MKTTIPALVAVVALASSSIACSAEEKTNEVDADSAISALQSPTGTLTRESAGKAFGGYRQQRAESSKVSAPTQGGGLVPGSIRVLDQTSAAGGQGGSQRCPAGGSMTYQAEQSANGALVKVRAEACAFEDGFSFDGNMIVLASKKSILGLSSEESEPAKPTAPAKPGSGSATGSGDDAYDDSYGDSMAGGSGAGVSEAQGTSGYGSGYVALLVAAKGTATYAKSQTSLEFALLTESRYAFLAVKVNDGSIVIGMRDDGLAIVRTKNGNWTCRQSGTSWSCSNANGEKLEAAEEASGDLADNESGPVPPPSGSGSSSSDKAPAPPSGDQG